MKEQASRRNFLKKMTGAGMATLVFPALSKSNPARLPMMLCSRDEQGGLKINQPGWEILRNSGGILDAVEKSTNVAELDPEDESVGYGGLPNEHGEVELDASIMYGPTHRCGSVAALKQIRTPCSVARLVMERTDHMMLVGKGALAFALAHGFQKENLLTEKSRLKWLRWKENLSDEDDWLPPADGMYREKGRSSGTINVFALDQNGDIAGVTSTSGLAFKIPGRVGDSPIIGAGLYVDNEVGAAGATGRGEEVIRTCGSFYVVELMRQGLSPQQACEKACHRIIEVNGGFEKTRQLDFNDKFIAVNVNGELGCASIRSIRNTVPKLSYINPDGFKVYEGKIIIPD